MKSWHRLLAVFALASPLLAACEDAESEFFLQLAADWATEKGLLSYSCTGSSPSDCEYDLNEVALGAYITLGRMGAAFSPDGRGINAALDGAEVVRRQEEADELAAAGTEQGNLDLIDQAIALRPDDWSYHEQRAALLLAQHDDSAAQASFAASETLVQERIRDGARCEPLMLNMLHHRAAALDAQAKRDPEMGVLEELRQVQNDILDLEGGEPNRWCP
jgi:hypothetical protein